MRGQGEYDIPRYAKRSLIIFGTTLVIVMVYAVAVGSIKNPPLPRTAAIICLMFAAALAIRLFCKIELGKVADQATFKGGMSAAICILGVAWLGTPSSIQTLMRSRASARESLAISLGCSR
nr:anaerobic C4-dicarboxylate transporter family protein [Propionibacterium freudenreichii]